MKNRKIISILVILIGVLSLFSCIIGLMNQDNTQTRDFLSITGETVKIYGSGLYKNDSLSVVAQGQASDFVTLFLAIPLLFFSLIKALKQSFRGSLLLIGTLAYFLYTYVSYTFLWTYNNLFIVYVALMSMSLFALILSIQTIDLNKLPSKFSNKLPLKLLSAYQFFIAVMIGMLWMGKIITSLLTNTPPIGLEHYTTLVIQAMDLGFVVPLAFLSGYLLLKKKPYGYLLTSIIVLKGISMLTSITAMILNMMISGIEVSLIELSIFIVLDILGGLVLILFLRGIKED